MEAKDRVLPYLKVSNQIPMTLLEFIAKLEEQDEISFKAGIREVVKWIHEEFGGYIPDSKGGLVLKNILIDEEYGENGSMDKWQAKLKEWGI